MSAEQKFSRETSFPFVCLAEEYPQIDYGTLVTYAHRVNRFRAGYSGERYPENAHETAAKDRMMEVFGNRHPVYPKIMLILPRYT